MNRYIEENNYGGHTWEVKIKPVFRILFHGTRDNSFVIELQEFKWIRHRTIWSITSNSNLETAIRKAFDRLFKYFLDSDDYNWTESQRDNTLEETLRLYRNSKFYDETNPKDDEGFQLIERPGEYALELLGEPEMMPWGTYQIHFKAKTPDHFSKSIDDYGTRHETLYLELSCDYSTIEELGNKAKCYVDYYTDFGSGQKILNIVGIDSLD